MKIELKRISHNVSLSEETYAFSADIWLDGVKAGDVRNAGHGGCHDYHPRDLGAHIDSYAKTLPPVDCSDLYSDGAKHTIEQDADILISDLVTQWLRIKDMKRALSKRIIYTLPGKPGVYQTKAFKAEQVKLFLANRADVFAKLKADKVLNYLSEAEALAIYAVT